MPFHWYYSNLLLGKILNDDQPLSTYKIDEKGFVVVMVTKVKVVYLLHQILTSQEEWWMFVAEGKHELLQDMKSGKFS